MTVEHMISSDSHIIEPPDLWERRIDRAFRDRAPRVVQEETGDWWVIDGERSMSFLGIQTGDRFEKDATELVTEARFTTTTEVYPDSPKVTDEDCNRAQVAAVRGALDFVLAR